MAVDWSGIPMDLILLIAEQALKNGVCDVVSMAGVCRWWRGCLRGEDGWIRRTLMAVSPPDHFPKLMLPEKLPNAVGVPNDDRDYIHRGGDIYFRLHLPELRGSRCCGSGYGWLVTARDDDFLIRLVNPITRQQIQLPGIPFFWVDNVRNIHEILPNENFMTKAIVIGNPSESEAGYTVAAIMIGHLFWLTDRRHAKMWTRVEPHSAPIDIAHDKDVLYIFSGNLVTVEAWRMSTGQLLWFCLRETPIPSSILDRYNHFRSYLLQVADGIICAVSRPLQLAGNPVPENENDSLAVFRVNLDPSWTRFVQVTNLGDCCLFLGDNTSMALSPVPPDCGFQPNHVYFTRSCSLPPEIDGYDWGVYNLGDGTYQRFSFVNAAAHSLSPSLWVAFNPGRAA